MVYVTSLLVPQYYVASVFGSRVSNELESVKKGSGLCIIELLSKDFPVRPEKKH